MIRPEPLSLATLRRSLVGTSRTASHRSTPYLDRSEVTAMSTEARVRTERTHSFRWTFVGLEAFVALGAWSGVWQLWTGTFAPPVSDLEPLGLTDWRLPALWLLVSVAVPATVALLAAWERLPWTPTAVLVMAVLLVIEVTVQVPFVGPSALQAVMGAVAVLLGILAWVARSRGDWARTSDG